jgi:hypothetical protein
MANMETGAYRFADLEYNEQLLSEISHLEAKMQQELGKDVTLIAYSKGKAVSPEQE